MPLAVDKPQLSSSGVQLYCLQSLIMGLRRVKLDQQGVKSYVKLGARVTTNSVSEAKCSFRGGGSSSRACVRLACGQEGRAPPHVPQHPAATQHQGQPWGRRKPGALCWVRLECVGDMPSAPMLLLLLCSVKPKFTQAQFHLVATMFFWPWNLLLDWNLYCSQKKF